MRNLLDSKTRVVAEHKRTINLHKLTLNYRKQIKLKLNIFKLSFRWVFRRIPDKLSTKRNKFVFVNTARRCLKFSVLVGTAPTQTAVFFFLFAFARRKPSLCYI